MLQRKVSMPSQHIAENSGMEITNLHILMFGFNPGLSVRPYNVVHCAAAASHPRRVHSCQPDCSYCSSQSCSPEALPPRARSASTKRQTSRASATSSTAGSRTWSATMPSSNHSLRRCAATLKACFFQAEDGIRDLTVTGVQTCALPIYQADGIHSENPKDDQHGHHDKGDRERAFDQDLGASIDPGTPHGAAGPVQRNAQADNGDRKSVV